MENQPTPEIQTPKTFSKTFWIIVAIVAAATVIAVLILRQTVLVPEALIPPAVIPAIEAPPVAPEEPDTTTSIQQDLKTIDLGDLEQEFQQINTEAGGL